MVCVQVSSRTANAVVLAFGLIGTVAAEGEIHALGFLVPAFEAWDVAVDGVNAVPPFPMIIDLVMEPNVDAAPDGNVGHPGGVEVLLDHCVGSVNVSIGWDRHLSVNLPCVGVGG